MRENEIFHSKQACILNSKTYEITKYSQQNHESECFDKSFKSVGFEHT